MKKKLMSIVIVVAFVLSVSGAAMASMSNPEGYPDFSWSGEFQNNSMSSYDNAQTRVIQRALNSSMNVGLVADGIFGTNTDAKVRTYQRLRPALVEDGIVGPATWTDWQSYINWSHTKHFSTGRNMYYYEYKTINDSSAKIRQYEDGAWYVLGSNGIWYRAN